MYLYLSEYTFTFMRFLFKCLDLLKCWEQLKTAAFWLQHHRIWASDLQHGCTDWTSWRSYCILSYHHIVTPSRLSFCVFPHQTENCVFGFSAAKKPRSAVWSLSQTQTSLQETNSTHLLLQHFGSVNSFNPEPQSSPAACRAATGLINIS